MKKIFKYFGYFLIVIATIIFIAVIYINTQFPSIELRENFKVEVTEHNIKRGEYLVNSVTACFHCHSNVDFSKFSGKIVKGTFGKGGRYYTEGDGFPGNFYSSNITPFNLKDWSDAEIYRAITSGINRDNEALFPLMPYYTYKYLTEEDAKSIIAYLRTLESIEAEYSKSEFSFPFSMILKTIPNEPEAMVKVDTTNSLEYGKYLVTIAGCESCHSPTDAGEKIAGLEFSGGFEIPMETGGLCKAANITPDLETGIGSWTKDKFIARFKYYENIDHLNVKNGEFNSEMPWSVYATMSEKDLGSIYDYLKTVKPVKNRIAKFIP